MRRLGRTRGHRRRCVAAAHGGCQFRDDRAGLRAHFLAYQGLVNPRVIEGRGPVARRVQRAHESRRGACADRLEVGECVPPTRGLARIVASDGPFRETLQRPSGTVREGGALRRRPPLEPARATYVEAVEKRRDVECDGRLVVPAAERLTELGDVARNDRGVQPELGGRKQELWLLELRAERVNQLSERGAGVLLVTLRPQLGSQRVAARPALAGGRQHGQERERLALP